MNEFSSHIEFLLHSHNCVIVPGFGGFVVNYTTAKHDGLSVVEAPGCELVFNGELTHNDGLLAESYMKTDKISFDAATLRIKQLVRKMNLQLEEKKELKMGDLGTFSINEKSRLVYSPGAFVRPELFGLTKASLRPVIQIHSHTEAAQKTVRKSVVLRNTGIVAAVAAVILLSMMIFPFEGNKLNIQTAQIISELGLFNHADKIETPKENKAVTGYTKKTDIETTINNPQEEVLPETETVTNETNTDILSNALPETTPVEKYYIIVGVFKSQPAVDKTIELFQNKGFSDIHTLERGGRKHIYTSSFNNKEEALAYLSDIKSNYRECRDAWLLKN